MSPGTMGDLNARLERMRDAHESFAERVECAELRAEEAERECAKLRAAGEALATRLTHRVNGCPCEDCVPDVAAVAAWREALGVAAARGGAA